MAMTLTRRTTLALITAFAATPTMAGKPEIFKDGKQIAINGYDTVAYFKMSKPVEGDPEHSAMYMGATFLFSSAENKAMFEADPSAFAPQYGGYCAYAVSKGYTAKTDPDAWTIVDDKLYLNYSRAVRGIWSANIPGNIEKANANWPNVLN
jgi:YHS domain-containing protein